MLRSIPYPYVASFIPIDYIWLYPAFLLAPTFVVLMACIHYYVSDDKKIFSQIGLSFSLAYSAVIITDYFIQWTVVQPSILSRETEGLSLFTQYNPHGIFVGLEGLGYSMMNVAFLSARAKARRNILNGGKYALLQQVQDWYEILLTKDEHFLK